MTNGPSLPPSASGREGPSPRQSLPKSLRLLRPSDFRQVYDQGVRIPASCFVAFCWRAPEGDGPKIGFTAPRALGDSTRRNRMRRRLRETVRRGLVQVEPHWRIVWNLRRASLDAPQEVLDREVNKVLQRCVA